MKSLADTKAEEKAAKKQEKLDKKIEKACAKVDKAQHKALDHLNETGKNRFKEGRYFAFFDGDNMGKMKNELNNETLAEDIFKKLKVAMQAQKVNYLHGDEYSCVVDSVEDAENIIRTVRKI